jgi:hypothetical protein
MALRAGRRWQYHKLPVVPERSAMRQQPESNGLKRARHIDHKPTADPKNQSVMTDHVISGSILWLRIAPRGSLRSPANLLP